MIYNDYYNIDIQLNGTSLETSIAALNFSIHDSIYSFYNNASLSLKDPSGTFREHLLAMEGNKISIIYGDPNTILKCPYTISSDESDVVLSPGILNGNLVLNLNNAYYERQEVLSKSYNGIISTIVQSIVSDYKEITLNIDKTEGKNIWYRMFHTQKDFIEEVLIKNAFSYNSNKTPFYCFIGVDNRFNFTTYESMMRSSPVATLTFRPATIEEYNLDTVLDLKPFKTGAEKTRKFRNRVVYSRSTQTGEYSKVKETIDSYPDKKELNKLIPITSMNTLITGFRDASFYYAENGKLEAFKARSIFSTRDAMFLERFIVTISFNPLLKSGSTIILNVFTQEEGSTPTASSYNSGKYLIEDSIHSWTGDDTKRGITTMIVGRKFVSVPESYSLKKGLLGVI